MTDSSRILSAIMSCRYSPSEPRSRHLTTKARKKGGGLKSCTEQERAVNWLTSRQKTFWRRVRSTAQFLGRTMPVLLNLRSKNDRWTCRFDHQPRERSRRSIGQLTVDRILQVRWEKSCGYVMAAYQLPFHLRQQVAGFIAPQVEGHSLNHQGPTALYVRSHIRT